MQLFFYKECAKQAKPPDWLIRTGREAKEKIFFLCGPELNFVELWAGRRPVGPSAPRGGQLLARGTFEYNSKHIKWRIVFIKFADNFQADIFLLRKIKWL